LLPGPTEVVEKSREKELDVAARSSQRYETQGDYEVWLMDALVGDTDPVESSMFQRTTNVDTNQDPYWDEVREP
jgi:hypothetical protein